jgi:hypothetical protein
MSLLSSASEWNHKPSKKRISTLKRPEMPYEARRKEGYSVDIPESIQKTQDAIEEREKRVNSLLEKMTQSEDSNDESSLANYEPMSNPTVQVKKDFPPIQANQLNDEELYTPYSNAYTGNVSYKMPTVPVEGKVENDKLMEKINYMIHMLEQQQHERTENITEEFILYSFLGLFVVYVCDSFTRAGKYIR